MYPILLKNSCFHLLISFLIFSSIFSQLLSFFKYSYMDFFNLIFWYHNDIWEFLLNLHIFPFRFFPPQFLLSIFLKNYFLRNSYLFQLLISFLIFSNILVSCYHFSDAHVFSKFLFHENEVTIFTIWMVPRQTKEIGRDRRSSLHPGQANQKEVWLRGRDGQDSTS